MTPGSLPETSRLAGIVTREELSAAGVSADQVRRLLRGRALVPVGRGVYAPARPAAALADDPFGRHVLRVAAVLASMAPGAVASHRSAAIIHGLDLLGRVPGGMADLTRPPDGAGSRTGRNAVRIHVAGLPAGHVTECRGLPVTSVARTVVDLARSSPLRAAVVTADCALRRGLTSKEQLAQVLAACGRWHGIRRARETMAFADGRSESALESLSRATFHACGLPPPELQAWVGNDYEVIGRADFLWPRHRTVGEADGALKYSDPARAREQLRRDARLRDAGFEIVHFTWNEIVRDPDAVVAAVRRALHRGVTRGGRRNPPTAAM